MKSRISKIIQILLIVNFTISTTKPKNPKILSLDPKNLQTSFKSDYMENTNDNFYKITVSDTSLIKNKNFFIILESENPEFTISIFDTSNTLDFSSKKIMLDLKTYSGNLALAISDSYFNNNFDFFEETGNLYFKINLNSLQGEATKYNLKLVIAKNLPLTLGKIYTTRLDYIINNLTVDLKYEENQDFNDIHKLRFQLTTVLQKDNYTLSSKLKIKYENYLMNNIFKNIIGGILKEPEMTLCKNKDCIFSMILSQTDVKVLNIESFITKKIETLSINHLDEYYDKVYSDNTTTFYKLKYIKAMEDLDISISLIPVTGESELYINARTKPKELSDYYYSETGTLAKRITIKWEDLVQMKANGSDLYLAVHSGTSGEFMIKIDGHESGYRGRLTPGTLEAGFVKKGELMSYLYSFEVYETKEIMFDLNLAVISGGADLYFKSCESLIDCKLDKTELNSVTLYRIENNHNNKKLTKSITCEKKHKHKMNMCRYLITVYGKVDNGTHFHISLHENRYHTLLLPGHVMNLTLLSNEIKYLKFSYPATKSQNNLYINIDTEWGELDVFIDKKEEYPSQEVYTIKNHFDKNEKSKNLLISNDNIHDSLFGTYYIGIKSLSSSSLNIKFFVKKDNKLTLHALSAGSYQKGNLSDSSQILYYTTKISLDPSKSNLITVDLTPIKGKFIIFASNSGSFPNKQKNDMISKNNQISLKSGADDNDYIIGVQRVESGDENYEAEFYINLSYSDKSIKMKPGVIYSHTMKENNYFLIEILEEMEDILILKGIADGYNIKLCANFGSLKQKKKKIGCIGNADEKNVSLDFDKKQIKKGCSTLLKNKERCFLQLLIEGYQNQKFTIGFTYNNLPFQILDETLITGPTVLKKPIYFVYTSKPNKPVGFYFNTKGRKMNIYSLLTQGNDIEKKSKTSFPNAAISDEKNKKVTGHITTIVYDTTEVENQGIKPEILISIYPDQKNIKDEDITTKYDSRTPFYLQSFLDVKEIARTHVFSEYLFAKEYKYYQFYNNGNSESLRVYVNSNQIANLEVFISRDYKSRPPYNGKVLISKKGLNSVILELDKELVNEELKGHYTIAVKSDYNSLVHVYWNNKDDLDYIELTANVPASINLLKRKKLYFSFYVEDTDKEKKNISIHIKSDSKTEVFILSSKENLLSQPDNNDYHFKGSIGKKGGINLITIRPTDPHYCLNCTYVGYIQTNESSQATILYQIEHDDIPISINSGLTIPDYIDSHHSKKYRFVNIGRGKIFLHLSVLSGTCNIFLDTEEDVSMGKNKIEAYLGRNMEVHKFLTIDPVKYGLDVSRDLYILVSNPKLDPATYTLSVFKEESRIPIETGITKYLELGENEKMSFFFEQKMNEREFEIRLTLRKVENLNLHDSAIENLFNMIDVYYESTDQDAVKVENAEKSLNGNKLYIKIILNDNINNRNFVIKTTNALKTSISLTIDLLVGNYKLLNLNESIIDSVNINNIQIYESYGHLGRFIFMGMKLCYGKAVVQFYEGDYEKIGDKKHSKYKTLKDGDSLVHYFKLENERVFSKVTPMKDSKTAVYSLIFYNEQDIDNNPYSEITQGNEGKVVIETDNKTVNFDMIKMKKFKASNFVHKIKFSIYLASSLEVMRYLKNCEDFKITQTFEKPDYKKIEKIFTFANSEEISKFNEKIKISLGELEKNKKYYGVVVANASLIPLGEGFIEPVRRGRVYYDEFVFVSSKINIPLNSILIYSLILAFFVVVCYIVKGFVFDDVSRIGSGADLKSLRNLMQRDTVRNILESEYFGEERKKEVDDDILDGGLDQEKEIEMTNAEDKEDVLGI